MSVSDIVAPLSAPCPSGKGEVCKTFIHQFDSDRRLFPPLFVQSDNPNAQLKFRTIVSLNSFTAALSMLISSSAIVDDSYCLITSVHFTASELVCCVNSAPLYRRFAHCAVTAIISRGWE